MARKCLSPTVRIRSVHSARTVRMNRSATAFMRGACGAVIMTVTPIEPNTASNAVVNFASRSRIKWVKPQAGIVQVDGEATRQLGGPGGRRVLGDTQQVYPAGVVLDDERDIQPPQRDHAVDVEEVGGKDRVGVRAKEGAPRLLA